MSTRNEAKQEQYLSLVLHLHQFIELCGQQGISMERLVHKISAAQNPSLFDRSKFKLNLSHLQIASLINKNQFNIKKLSVMQQHMQAQAFRLNTSQLAYLFHNRRIIQNHTIGGLSASQLIALYVLYQSSFSLTYQQIEQLALIQSERIYFYEYEPNDFYDIRYATRTSSNTISFSKTLRTIS